jgi:hypothetical protein
MIRTRERQSPALSPINNRNRKFVERPPLVSTFDDLSKAVLLDPQAPFVDGNEIGFLSPAYFESGAT